MGDNEFTLGKVTTYGLYAGRIGVRDVRTEELAHGNDHDHVQFDAACVKGIKAAVIGIISGFGVTGFANHATETKFLFALLHQSKRIHNVFGDVNRSKSNEFIRMKSTEIVNVFTLYPTPSSG